ncbi:MAG: ABC transporter permease [Clostridia bacterium]|nr:ABC transporter permease [Clostridia bacterium]
MTVLLLTATSLILLDLEREFDQKEENLLPSVGITGDTSNEYLKFALTAFDAAKGGGALQVHFLEEEEAQEMLNDGSLSAYLILPEGFFEAASVGRETPVIRYVTRQGAQNLMTTFKEEFTRILCDAVLYAQKGTFGIDRLEGEMGKKDSESMTRISLEYVEMLLNRGDMLQTKETGIQDGLSTKESYLCGITLLFILFAALPFGILYAKKDAAFHALHLSRGGTVFGQVLSEWVAYFLSLLLILGLSLGIALFIPGVKTLLFPEGEVLAFLALLIPGALLFSLLAYCLFRWSQNAVTGTVLYVFFSLGMCFISGFFYPVHALPSALQSIEPYLPTSAARGLLAGAFTGKADLGALVLWLLWAVGFFLLSLVARQKELRGKEEVIG